MLVVLFVASVANARRLSVFLTRLVAVLAFDLGRSMCIFHRIVSLVVIKYGSVENDDFEIAPHMISMTFMAFLFFLQATMKAFIFCYILADFPVAFGA